MKNRTRKLLGMSTATFFMLGVFITWAALDNPTGENSLSLTLTIDNEEAGAIPFVYPVGDDLATVPCVATLSCEGVPQSPGLSVSIEGTGVAKNIEDGGIGDEDGIANGSIKTRIPINTPGEISVTASAPGVSPKFGTVHVLRADVDGVDAGGAAVPDDDEVQPGVLMASDPENMAQVIVRSAGVVGYSRVLILTGSPADIIFKVDNEPAIYHLHGWGPSEISFDDDSEHILQVLHVANSSSINVTLDVRKTRNGSTIASDSLRLVTEKASVKLIDPPSEAVVVDPVNLVAQGSPSGGIYLWSSTDEGVILNQNDNQCQVSSSDAGEKTVTVKYSINGGSSVATAKHTITFIPYVTIVNHTPSVDIGEFAHITAEGIPADCVYEWETDTPGVAVQGEGPEVKLTSQSVGIVTVTVKCYKNGVYSKPKQAKVIFRPKVQIAGPVELPHGENAVLTANGSPEGGSYAWEKSNPNVNMTTSNEIATLTATQPATVIATAYYTVDGIRSEPAQHSISFVEVEIESLEPEETQAIFGDKKIFTVKTSPAGHEKYVKFESVGMGEPIRKSDISAEAECTELSKDKLDSKRVIASIHNSSKVSKVLVGPKVSIVLADNGLGIGKICTNAQKVFTKTKAKVHIEPATYADGTYVKGVVTSEGHVWITDSDNGNEVRGVRDGDTVYLTANKALGVGAYKVSINVLTYKLFINSANSLSFMFFYQATDATSSNTVPWNGSTVCSGGGYELTGKGISYQAELKALLADMNIENSGFPVTGQASGGLVRRFWITTKQSGAYSGKVRCNIRLQGKVSSGLIRFSAFSASVNVGPIPISIPGGSAECWLKTGVRLELPYSTRTFTLINEHDYIHYFDLPPYVLTFKGAAKIGKIITITTPVPMNKPCAVSTYGFLKGKMQNLAWVQGRIQLHPAPLHAPKGKRPYTIIMGE